MIWLLGRRLQGKLTMLPSFAVAMAFCFLVSLVPFLIVVSRGVAAVFSANLMPELLSFLRDVLPPERKFRPDALAASISQGSYGLAAVSTMLAIWAIAIGVGAVAFVILPLAQGELTRLGAGRLLPRAFGSFAIRLSSC